MMAKPQRTDHGTANQAIAWVLYENQDGQEREFLTAWLTGDAESDWPDYYEWLDTQNV